MLLGILTASAILPVPTVQAGLFSRVYTRVGKTGLWELSNASNSVKFVKYSVSIKGSGIWQKHGATLPPNSTRMMGYDGKTYRLRVEEVK